jgi:hypothetical protein
LTRLIDQCREGAYREERKPRSFFSLKVSTWDTTKTFQIDLKLFGEALRANLEAKEALVPPAYDVLPYN